MKICHMNLFFGCRTPSMLQTIKSLFFCLVTLRAIGDSYRVGYIFILKYRINPPIWRPVFEIWISGSIFLFEKLLPFSPPEIAIFFLDFFSFLFWQKNISNWNRDLGLTPFNVKIYCFSDVFSAASHLTHFFEKPQKFLFSPQKLRFFEIFFYFG